MGSSSSSTLIQASSGNNKTTHTGQALSEKQQNYTPMFWVQPLHRQSNFFTYHYINLNHRLDRKQTTEQEFQRLNLKGYQRFSAIYDECGIRGCSRSHIACLEQALTTGADHIAIFEDDIKFLMSPEEFWELMQALQTIDYDVFVFTYSYVPKKGGFIATNHPLLRRITSCQSSTGYVISRHYAPQLLAVFKDGYARGLKDYNYPYKAVDMCWKKLQNKDKWFCYQKKIATQYPGFSDIQKRNVKQQTDFD